MPGSLVRTRSSFRAEAKRYSEFQHIPVTAVVFHNRQWGAEKKNQVDFYNRRFVAGELDAVRLEHVDHLVGVGDPVEGHAPSFRRRISWYAGA